MRYMYFLLLAILFAGCAKENKTFSLKTLRLNDYREKNLPVQKLHLEVFDGNTQLVHTDDYPSELTLPATFGIHSAIPMTLYNKTYLIKLWGDSSGCIGTCRIDVDAYQIIFPIDMEVKNDSLSVSVMGSWK